MSLKNGEEGEEEGEFIFYIYNHFQIRGKSTFRNVFYSFFHHFYFLGDRI